MCLGTMYLLYTIELMTLGKKKINRGRNDDKDILKADRLIWLR